MDEPFSIEGDHKETWSYNRLREAAEEGFVAMTLQGVAVTYTVFVLNADPTSGWPDKAVMIVGPDSGPYEFMKRWPDQDEDVPVWDIPVGDYKAASQKMRTVLHGIVDHVQDSVDAEMA